MDTEIGVSGATRTQHAVHSYPQILWTILGITEVSRHVQDPPVIAIRRMIFGAIAPRTIWPPESRSRYARWTLPVIVHPNPGSTAPAVSHTTTVAVTSSCSAVS